MRFFNLSAAKQDLIHGVSEAQIFAYAFWTVTLMEIVSLPYLGPLVDLDADASEFLFRIIFIVITVVGYRQCFYANGGNSGKDFLSRMACLGWVVCWRTLVPFVAFSLIAWGAFDSNNISLESQEVVLFDNLLTTFALTLYWIVLKKNVHDVYRKIKT